MVFRISLPHMNVEQNIAYPLKNLKLIRQRSQTVKELLELVNLRQRKTEKHPFERWRPAMRRLGAECWPQAENTASR